MIHELCVAVRTWEFCSESLMICYVRDFVHIYLYYSGSSGGCLSLRHNFAAADAAHLDSQWDIATCVLQASGDQIEIVLYVDNRRFLLD